MQESPRYVPYFPANRHLVLLILIWTEQFKGSVLRTVIEGCVPYKVLLIRALSIRYAFLFITVPEYRIHILIGPIKGARAFLVGTEIQSTKRIHASLLSRPKVPRNRLSQWMETTFKKAFLAFFPDSMKIFRIYRQNCKLSRYF